MNNIQRLRDLEGYLADPDVTVRIFEAFPDAVIVVDDAGLIQLVNVQAELMFGYHRKELFDKPVEILIPAELHDKHFIHRSNYFADPKTRPMGLGFTLKARRKDGSQIDVEINLSPIPSTHGPMVAAVIRRRR